MKVIVEVNSEIKPALETGDVITASDSAYLIVKDGDGYVARNFNGFTGLFGKFDSLELLTAEFYHRKAKGGLPNTVLCKKGEYELKLVRK